VRSPAQLWTLGHGGQGLWGSGTDGPRSTASSSRVEPLLRPREWTKSQAHDDPSSHVGPSRSARRQGVFIGAVLALAGLVGVGAPAFQSLALTLGLTATALGAIVAAWRHDPDAEDRGRQHPHCGASRSPRCRRSPGAARYGLPLARRGDEGARVGGRRRLRSRRLRRRTGAVLRRLGPPPSARYSRTSTPIAGGCSRVRPLRAPWTRRGRIDRSSHSVRPTVTDLGGGEVSPTGLSSRLRSVEASS
jgi:hypothetical protein